jgi:hypothetical protein
VSFHFIFIKERPELAIERHFAGNDNYRSFPDWYDQRVRLAYLWIWTGQLDLAEIIL